MNIDLSNLTDYTRRFADTFTGQTRIDILTRVGQRVGAAAVRIAAEYPEPSGKPLPRIYPRTLKDGRTVMSKFKSQKQQGKVFSLIKDGRVPYRRSGLLGKSMTSRVTAVTPTSVTTDVGTNVPYGALVLDAERQAAYHRGTWTPLTERLVKSSAMLTTVASTAYITEINTRLSGS